MFDRRVRKIMIIRDYWNQISERCSKLAKNKNITFIYKFNGDKFSLIYEYSLCINYNSKVRDTKIREYVHQSELKY